VTGVRRFRAASYNIHSGIGRDGHLDLARIAAVIHETRADLIGLQEVGDWREGLSPQGQFQELGARLGLAGVAGPTLPAGSDYGNALFTRWPVVASRTIDLRYERREPRAAIDADVDIDGEILRVIVTHFGLSPRERTKQVEMLRDVIEDHAGPLLIMGDFNVIAWEDRKLRRLGAPADRVRPRSFPAWRPVLALDRIWSKPVPAMGLRAHRSPLARRASDHLPVVADIPYP
jgi:endonuclease/exonuclease/phosphatase family metal-dependent hydrolase